MGQGFDLQYFPNPATAGLYKKRFEQYLSTGNMIQKSTRTKPAVQLQDR